jgi:hypothetical protein
MGLTKEMTRGHMPRVLVYYSFLQQVDPNSFRYF